MSELDTDLVRSPIHRALSRPNLLLGADRELTLITGLATAVLVFVVLTWFSVLLGILVWITIIAGLRAMAKSDPLMRQVYRRHLWYAKVYRPTSTPRRRF